LIGASLLIWLSLTAAAFAEPAAAVRYVIPGGATSGACASWAAACNLPYALGLAASGDELWVKAGTHKPTTGSDRSATFQLKNNVSIYGGFAGTETTRDQRNWTTNVTILSGDIGVSGSDSDNVYHVVTGSSTNNTALLDGFTVTGGNANGAANPDDQGGGMFNYYGSPTVRNVIFSNNTATTAGGGMYNDHSSPAVQSVTFRHNTSTGNGGALYNSFESNATLTGVTFEANSVTGGNGGALLNDYSSPILVNVTFSNNSVTGGNGGALYNDLVSVPVLTNVTFSGNSATMSAGYTGGYGGALYNYATTTPPRLINVTFSGNRAIGYDASHPAYGGALYIVAGSVGMTNTILWGNTPDQLYNDSANVVSLNTSIVQGGCPTGSTCSNIITSDPLLGALGNYGGSVATLPLLPNSPAIDTANDSACPATDARGISRPIGSHCDIGAFESSRFTLAITGGNNQSTLINTAFAQPLRVSVTANNAVEPVNGGRVIFTPPASGASASLLTSPATITNSAASVNATANGVRGAYVVSATMAGANTVGFTLRNLSPLIFYVKPGTTGNCSSWATACELQTALAQAFYGDEIWVATGAYKPTTGSDRNATFSLPNGVGVYGGFAGTETTRSQRNWTTNVTALNGDLGAIGTASDNVYHVVSANATDSATTLDGFTVTNGYGNGQTGGGVYINNGSLTIANCRITHNSADYGGGVFQSGDSGRVAVIDSRIELNTVSYHGGGLYVSGNAAVTNTQIVSNTAAMHGGGLHVNAGRVDLFGGLFTNNRAGLNGGGLNTNNHVSINGTHFISNTAGQQGGGFLQWSAGYTVTISNARVERNVAGQQGGGLWTHGTTTLLDTHVISNSAANWGGGVFQQGGVITLTRSVIEGNTSTQHGGGVVLNGGTALFSRSRIVNNTAAGHGGGLDVWTARLNLINVVIADNHAALGNGIYLYDSPLDALHTTLARNTGGQGSGIYVNHDLPAYNTVTLTNTILVSQTVGVTATATNTVTFNGVLWFGNGAHTGGAGSFNVQHATTGDPAFAADGYRLTRNSLAIDHGVSAGVSIDLDGDLRPIGSGADLGADEFCLKVYLPVIIK
jgi:predicted outer membrane repeat protein